MPSQDRRYDVFLSHNSADKPAVQVLADQLRAAGFDPFLDTWHLIPGTPWQEGIEQALEDSDAVAVFVGPSGISPWHNEEMRDALDRAVRSRDDYRVIPVLLPGADESSVSRFLARRVWVDFRTGLDDDAALQRLLAGIKGEAVEVGSYALPDEPAPYRGLLPFEAKHARFFFGREADIERLIGRLAQHPFVAVVGASGSGKSSLVKAGLLPRLGQNALPDSNRWRVLTLTPGSQPLRSLANQLAPLVPAQAHRLQTTDVLTERLQARNDGLRTAVTAYMADVGQPVLVFVDQFEELFTLCQEGPERCRAQAEQFVANMVDAVQRGSGQVQVLITLRADFLDRCLALSELRELLEDRQLLLGPMDESAMREAIVRPAQAVGALLEKGLVEVILRDVGTEPGMLPLLQQALFELWLRRRGPWLTLEAYEQSGGVLGALQKRADDTYRSLTSEQQEIARSIFLRLTALGEGVSDTRRRVRLEEIYPSSQDRSQVDAVLQTLSSTQARLIVADENTAEVAHEALILQWPSLRRWLEEDREALHIHRHLTESAEEWERLSRDPGELYRGARLSQAEEWAASKRELLNALEQEFLKASLNHRDQEAKNLEHQRQLELTLANKRAEEALGQIKAEKARVKRLRVLLTILTVIMAPFLLVGIMGLVKRASSWQPNTGFPRDPVLTLTAATAPELTPSSLICVGTAGIGVGCSLDGDTWNIYRQDLPAGGGLPTGFSNPFLGDIGAVYVIAADTNNPQHLYAYVAGSGIVESQNSGLNWIPVGASWPQTVPREIISDGNVVLVLSMYSAQLFTSSDGGENWLEANGADELAFREVYSVHYSSDERVVYVGTDTGLYRSEFGSAWQWEELTDLTKIVFVENGLGGNSGLTLAVLDPRDHVTIYAWDALGEPSCLAVTKRPLVALTVDPAPQDRHAYALLENGKVLAIHPTKGEQHLGRRPSWWNIPGDLGLVKSAYDLMAAPSPTSSGFRLLMAHPEGLMELTPTLTNDDDWSHSCQSHSVIGG